MTRIRHIFRWDLDKTYLKTEFDSVADLVRTARLSAEQRENIPGSAALIKAIRDCAPSGFQHLVYFISGSPQQMRKVIEKKFALDGFIPDGFVLKPTVSNFLRGRFRAIRGQVPYKLAQLLLGRADAPIGARETLFGDDAESDAFVYSLYADVVAGRVPRKELLEVLVRGGAYADQVRDVERALESIVHEQGVRRVIIHLDQRTPPLFFRPYFPRVVPIYNHLQTALVLYLDGTLAAEAIRNVARELMAQYAYDVPRLTNLAEDIMRRQRLLYPLDRLDVLARELRALDCRTVDNGTPAGEPLDARTKEVVDRIAERAEYLRSRPLPDEAPPTEPERRDYLALLEAESRRRAEIKETRRAHGNAREGEPSDA